MTVWGRGAVEAVLVVAVLVAAGPAGSVVVVSQEVVVSDPDVESI